MELYICGHPVIPEVSICAAAGRVSPATITAIANTLNFFIFLLLIYFIRLFRVKWDKNKQFELSIPRYLFFWDLFNRYPFYALDASIKKETGTPWESRSMY
jgi:hypothetical protein